MEIGIDFDGTVVTHEYPNIGRQIGAYRVLKDLVEAGHKLILNTMRSGEYLQDAVDWFERLEIPLYGINENPTQKEWTESPKVYANLYIDDAALGVPLTVIEDARPHVDWRMVRVLLEKDGLLASSATK